MVERSQRFGIDFMKTGGASNRAVAKGDGKALEDYYSWGQPVLSPVAGVVRKVHDGDPDNPIGTRDKKNAFGNYVVIEAGPQEFVYLAHFQKGSAAVKEDSARRPTAGLLSSGGAIHPKTGDPLIDPSCETPRREQSGPKPTARQSQGPHDAPPTVSAA
jgi:hypothetical protein